MENKIYEINFATGKLEECKNAELQINQIFFLNGYGQSFYHHDRLAIYEIENSSLGSYKNYKFVNLDKLSAPGITQGYSLKPASDLSKTNAIGHYYTNDFADPDDVQKRLIESKQFVIDEKNRQEKASIEYNEKIKLQIAEWEKNNLTSKIITPKPGKALYSYNIKEIAGFIRNNLKEIFPDCKFSVTKESYSGGASITIALMEGNFKALTDDSRKNYFQCNQYHIKDSDELTSETKDVLSKVMELVNVWNYDNSDIQSDYFDVNFHSHLHIGKWDNPYKQKS